TAPQDSGGGVELLASGSWLEFAKQPLQQGKEVLNPLVVPLGQGFLGTQLVFEDQPPTVTVGEGKIQISLGNLVKGPGGFGFVCQCLVEVSGELVQRFRIQPQVQVGPASERVHQRAR